MMRYFSFTLDKPVLYYKGGEFVSKEIWQHQPVNHKGDYEIILCMKGNISVQINNEQFIIRPHEVMIVPPYTDFCGCRPSNPPVDFYWLHFFSQFKERAFNSSTNNVLKEWLTHASSRQQLVLPRVFKPDNVDQIAVQIHQILAIQDNPVILGQRDFLTSALLIQLFDSYSAHEKEAHEGGKMRFIKEWIRVNMSSELSVDEIAMAVQLSPDYLTRLFKQSMGITTLQYLTRLKIEVATLLLVRTEMSVKEIADYAYFNDAKTFMRRFRAQVGMSPTEYRRSYTSIHLNNPHVDPQIPLPKEVSDLITYIPENGTVQNKLQK